MGVTTERIEALLAAVVAWAAERPDVEGVAPVGSRARGRARPDSDVDLVIVAADPAAYLREPGWPRRFGPLRSLVREDWGLVQSLRAVYEEGVEVEFGLTDRRWVAVDPVDEGTARVISAGARVLFDRVGELGRLITAVGPPGGRRDPPDW